MTLTISPVVVGTNMQQCSRPDLQPFCHIEEHYEDVSHLWQQGSCTCCIYNIYICVCVCVCVCGSWQIPADPHGDSSPKGLNELTFSAYLDGVGVTVPFKICRDALLAIRCCVLGLSLACLGYLGYLGSIQIALGR